MSFKDPKPKPVPGTNLGPFTTGVEDKQVGRLADVFQGPADGIVINRAVVDESGRIVDFIVEYANEAACHLTGLKPDKLVGRRVLDIFPGQRENGQFDAYVHVVETGETLVRHPVRECETSLRSDPDGYGLSYAISVAKFGDGCVATLHDIGARKRAEDDLARSQQLLRVVLDTIPLRVFWKDRNSVFLGSNHPYAHDAGLDDPSELMGKTDYDMTWSAEADRYRADDRLVMETGEPKLMYEEAQPRPDGTIGWIRTSKVPMRDLSGAVIGILGTYEDVTDRKVAEEALRKSEQLLENIVDNIPDMVFVKDARDLSYVLVNRAEERIVGFTKEEILRGDDRGQSTPAEVEFFEAIDRKVLETGEIVEIPEERLTTIHGVRILHTTKIPIMNKDGRPRYLLGISEDITQRKAAEAAKLESEERYRRIVDTISDYVVSVKIENGQVAETAHGAGCYALTGYTADELTRDPDLWMSLVIADDKAAAQEQTGRILAGKSPEHLEHRIVRRDGAVRWVRQTPVIRTNADGVLVGYDGVIQDITESRELQEQLLQSANLDSLTGTGSRRLMDFELVQLMANVRRTGHPAAIVMIDIDNFKLYNDSYGHGAGDVVLVDVARSIQQSIRPDDRLYRYGGEEFLVSLRAGTLDGAVSAAGRIVSHVAKQAISHPANQPWGVVTISAGVALMTPDQGSLAAVLAQADKGLYESKANGRNRVS